MEFHEKLQGLRKQAGLTQEELAQQLYVSRTAISKWESGRGYPNIDSLKAISKFFSVSIDDLLSGEEVLHIAEDDRKEKDSQFRGLVFALLDCSAAMFLFLPIFGQQTNDSLLAVSLLSLSGVNLWLKAAYLVSIISIVAAGILSFTLRNCGSPVWKQSKTGISLGFSMAGVLLFIIGRQPYASALLFVFLMIKLLILKKKG